MKKLITLILLLHAASLQIFGEESSEFKIKSMGLSGGLVDPEDLKITYGTGLHCTFETSVNSIMFRPSIEFWRKIEKDNILFYEVEGMFSELSVNLDGTYTHPVGVAEMYAGGGLAFIVFHKKAVFNYKNHLMDSLYQEFGMKALWPQETVDIDYELGINLFGGIEVPVSDQLALGFGVKYKINGLNAFKVSVGMSYLFESKKDVRNWKGVKNENN